MKITGELIEVPDEPGAYYQVPIYRHEDGTHTATLPGIGRCEVAKRQYQFPCEHESFAYHVVKILKFREAGEEKE